MCCFIEFCKVNGLFPKGNCVHSTTDIDTNNIGHCLVLDGHCRADSTALSGVNIWHDAHSAAFGQLVAAHATDLFSCLFINRFGIGNRSRDTSFDSLQSTHHLRIP